jgi:hypothetical protein
MYSHLGRALVKIPSSTSTPSNDTLQFNPALFVNYAAVMRAESFDGHNTTITTPDDNNSVTLQNVAPSALHASNFTFT